jgi:hypothetical protein
MSCREGQHSIVDFVQPKRSTRVCFELWNALRKNKREKSEAKGYRVDVRLAVYIVQIPILSTRPLFDE